MDLILTAQRDDEIFDVVNDRDEVTGQSTRKEVHRQRLMHRSIHALVFGGDGRVFLQKRSMLKDSSPGKWDASCSGHVDGGEHYDAAVVRELGEEIGLVVTPEHGLEPLFKLPPSLDTGWEFVWVYRLRSEGPFVLHPAEIERGDWFTADDITRGMAERPLEFTRPFRLIWPRVRAAIGV
ncbi:NUDIX hydrolase [Rariglobus hedericola]|uniref:NUDIX domain-containing protein n=1 Tax=Rariglobus hedericola TaxID=2597822 RepID=A0A556QQZ4_9BACT|nr:NUDIX domain-containing protein [Rariglobus hedericola]TSJ79061.1 NUDIX domain-containing protein [Rariglobus hedericola]